MCAPMRITAPAAAAAALLACLALARTASIRSMAALIEGDEKGKKKVETVASPLSKEQG